MESFSEQFRWFNIGFADFDVQGIIIMEYKLKHFHAYSLKSKTNINTHE